MSLTYVAVVLVVGIVAALVARRQGWLNGLGSGLSGGSRGAGDWFREQLVGAGGHRRGDDLVERLARCLAEETVALGASYAVPGFIGVVLPRGVYRAASATKPQLVAEITNRYAELMTDQARREGRRQEFVMPPGYTLRLVLACGPSERSVASFEPIGDVHAALGLPAPEFPALGSPTASGSAGRQLVSSGAVTGTAVNATALNGTAVNGTAVNGSVLNGSGDLETRNVPTSGAQAAQDVTVQRVPLRDSGVGFALLIDGTEVAQCRRSAGSPGIVVIGRGSHVGLRCPSALAEVSREHAELTFADGRVWVEDKHSANGTWLRKADGSAQRLVPGELTPVEADDAIWLDEARRATVTQLRTTA